MRKNLLIGAITNYTWDDIAPFFNSYIQAGFENCECVMFTGNMPEATLDKMRSYGVNVQPIPEKLLSGRIINIRWKIYANFLKNNTDKYNMVLTADIRDVFFQSDLFQHYDPDKSFLGVALEDWPIYRDQIYNSRWIIDAYGDDVYQKIKDEMIICVGTVWGKAEEFLKYSQIMSDILNSEWAAQLNVIEQGVGNYIIYHDKMFADVLSPSTNADGYVMTIGLTDSKDIHTDSAGNVLNGKGEIASVVHQYDRKPAVIDIVVRKYGAGMSAFSKAKLKHTCDNIGRVLRFLSRVHRRGFFRSVFEAVKRRI